MACKKTSSSVASKASKLLKDGRTSKTTKSVAGSALSQRQPKHTHKKKWLFVNSWGKKSSKKIERVKDGFEK